jgi:phosphate transport system protein
MPPRPVLERSLIDLTDNVLRLASMADQALALAMRALVERNAALAAQVSANDQQLNRLRYAIEEECYRLLAMQHPNATDLRHLVGTVSVATNLERIGDHAAGVARLALRMIDAPPPRPLVDIPQMAVIGREMVRGAVQAFVTHNVPLAEAIIRRDEEIGQLQKRTFREMIDLMTELPYLVERATFLLWISHNLERVGDRATNICERAIYVVTGEIREHSES